MRLLLLVVLSGCATTAPTLLPCARPTSSEPRTLRSGSVGRPDLRYDLATLGPSPTRFAATDFVSLARLACFGSCPVYTVTIFGDGRVVAEGTSTVERLGKHQWSIDPELAQRVLAHFVEVDFFSLETSVSGVTDLPSTRLQALLASRAFKLQHYGAGWEGGGGGNLVATKLESLVDTASEVNVRLVGCVR